MKFIRLDTDGYAMDVEDKLYGLMKEPPVGIYISTKIEPIMVSNRMYHSYDTNNNKIRITDIEQIKKPVYDDKDNVIIGTWLIQNKANNISNKPILPYWGTKLLIASVEDLLNSIAPYRTGSTHRLDTMLENNMLNTSNYENILAMVNQILDDINRQLLEFIGDDRWNVYHIEFKHGTLQITKDQDYRILEWEKMQESKSNDGE